MTLVSTTKPEPQEKSERSGLFITLEGMEGVGKTVQIRALRDQLSKDGYDVVITREPGGTSVGDQIRAILLDAANADLDPLTELHLFHAQRAQHVRQLVWPAIDRGCIVLCDRFADSSIVYQGLTREVVNPAVIITETDTLLNGRWPDLTVVLTHSEPLVALRRAMMRWKIPTDTTAKVVNLNEARFDMLSEAFHIKVNDGYCNKLAPLFASFPSINREFAFVSAEGTEAEVAEEVIRTVYNFIEWHTNGDDAIEADRSA
jgi:dTMP kinase